MKILAKPIDMYALFMKMERPTPVRFRIEEEDSFKTIKVNKIESIEKINRAGSPSIIYRCRSTIGGIERQYELRYKMIEGQWDLYKM